MHTFHYIVALIAAAWGLTSALPAFEKREADPSPKALSTRSLIRRAGDGIYDFPVTNALILHLVAQHLLFGDDDIFGVEVGEVPVPAPPPPVAPIDMTVGVNSLIDSILRRANNHPNPVGGRTTRVTTFLMEGRPIVVQLVMEPIGQLTWADVVRMANGVENVREFVETYATIAINNRIGTTTVAMHAVMEGGVQGVQIAMFTFQWTPPA